MRSSVLKQLSVEKLRPGHITEKDLQENTDFISQSTICRWMPSIQHSHGREAREYQLVYKDK
jgi:hypothetical protein